jgi:hypothetical protein
VAYAGIPREQNRSGPCASSRIALTLPSRGRPQAGFACLRPPLMSNVRALAVHPISTRSPFVVALLVALFVAGACAGEPSVQPPRLQLAPYTVTVAVGKPALIPEEALTVELLEVKDNRCAVEVKCVWAGHTELTLQVSKPGTAAKALAIGTLAPASMNLPFEATYASYRLSLLGLEPANSIANPVPQSLYRATVKVTKL